MPAGFCIPQVIAEELQKAAREGKFRLDEMFDMTSAERRALFEDYVSKDMAKDINAGFEESMVSKQQGALNRWVEKTFKGEKDSPVRKDVLTKIKQLSEAGKVVTPDGVYLEDLVASKLGSYVKPEEFAELKRRGEELDKLGEKKDQFGNPSDEYFMALEDAQKYINSLTPTNKFSLVMNNIRPASLLFKTSSTFFNIVANTLKASFNRTEFLMAEAIDSGFFGRTTPILRGDNSALVSEYVKSEISRFTKTGFSLTRATDLEKAQSFIGETMTHAEGKGILRKYGRFLNKWVMRMGQGVPDVYVASQIRAQTANLLSTKWAKEQGLEGEARRIKAAEIMKDSLSVTPKTSVGKEIAARSIAEAEDATNTNNSEYAKFAIGVRNVFNNIAPRLKLGKTIAPFVRTPANVIGYGIDASGGGIIKGVINYMDYVWEGAKEGNWNRAKFMKGTRNLLRPGVTLVVAYGLLQFVHNDDVEGEYNPDPKIRALQEAKNTMPNSMIIDTPFGPKVISTDYLGPVGVALKAMKELRDKGDGNFIHSGVIYGSTVGKSLTTLPGLNEYVNIYKFFDDSGLSAASSPDDVLKAAGDFTAQYVSSVALPGFVSDVAKISDSKERKVNPGDTIGAIMSKIPGLRQQLPVKTTVFGDEVKTEDPITILFAGSRIKTPIQNGFAKEYQRLDNLGEMPSIVNFDRPTGNLKALREQIGGDEYNQAKGYFRENFGKSLKELMGDASYKELSADMKKKVIENIQQSWVRATLGEYNFKFPEYQATEDTTQ